jgi:hypothetical protein
MRVIQVDGGAAVGDNLFLVELDDDRDAHVGSELAVGAIDLLLEAQLDPLDLAYLDALELDRCADSQAVDVAGEVDDKFVGLAEQVARTNAPTVAGLIRLPMIPR